MVSQQNRIKAICLTLVMLFSIFQAPMIVYAEEPNEENQQIVENQELNEYSPDENTYIEENISINNQSVLEQNTDDDNTDNYNFGNKYVSSSFGDKYQNQDIDNTDNSKQENNEPLDDINNELEDNVINDDILEDAIETPIDNEITDKDTQEDIDSIVNNENIDNSDDKLIEPILLEPAFIDIIDTSPMMLYVTADDMNDNALVLDAPSNIVNGSFEDPVRYNGDAASSAYEYTPAEEVTAWNTTATNNKIELGWMYNKTSQHMTTVLETEDPPMAYDGYQFSEIVANELGTMYQIIPVQLGDVCEYSFAHRARPVSSGKQGLDTMAMIIGPNQNISYSKTNKEQTDHFGQMIEWIKSNYALDEINGTISKFVIYTAPMLDNCAFDCAEDVSPFSTVQDDIHTEQWLIYTATSNEEQWNLYEGTITNDFTDSEMFVGITRYSSLCSTITSGNLVDGFSLKINGIQSIYNGGFENVDANGAYKIFPAQNASSPTENIGWCQTTVEKTIEIGNLANDRNAYKIPTTKIYISKTYIRDGKQFAELNASEESTLYQVIKTDPGKMYRWSLSHRGRAGIDTMALIIGPNQSIPPSKTGNKGRDQLMQMVDWVKVQDDYPIDIIENGVTNVVQVWTSPFSTNGTFTSSNPFSWLQDETHSECWNIWIISSDNQKWYDYGTSDPNRTYSCNYIVPAHAETSIFGFVSFESTPPQNSTSSPLTYGNLLDNITFFEYYNVTINNSANNSGSYTYIDSPDDTFIFESPSSGWALDGHPIKITVIPGDRPFLGGIINDVFHGISEWEQDPLHDGRWIYKYGVDEIKGPISVTLVHQSNNILYDATYGLDYDYDNNGGGPEVKLSVQSPEYVSHAATPAKDGQEFIGWRFTPLNEPPIIFQAEHTMKYTLGEPDENNNVPEYLEILGQDINGNDNHITGLSPVYGLTMYAEWKYRYRYITQVYNELTGQYDISGEGGTVYITPTDNLTIDQYYLNGEVVGKDAWVSASNTQIRLVATANYGYVFKGWYNETGTVLSTSPSYIMLSVDGEVKNIYALFDIPRYRLNINSITNGNMGDKNKYFEYTLNISGLLPNREYEITRLYMGDIIYNGQIVKNPTILATDNNGRISATIYMKNGDKAIVSGLRVGVEYSLIETDKTNLNYTITGEVENATVQGAAYVTITNTYNTIVPTGIEVNIMPYVLLVVLSGYFLCIIIINRRKDDIDE